MAPPALGEPLNPDELRVVEQRVSAQLPSAAKLEIPEGDTVLLEHTMVLKAGQLRGKEADYEGLVTGIVSPEGVVVHPRLDSFRLDTRGPSPKVHVVYAMHVDPGTRNGGRVQLTLSLIERRGLANLVAKERITHWVNITDKQPTQRDLLADFRGYRLYGATAQTERRALANRRLQVSLKDNGRMPALNRANDKTALAAYHYDQVRRRMWIAHRHLVSASRSPNRDLANAARTYLAQLDTPEAQLKGLPATTLIEVAAAPPRPAEVETLQPVSSEAAPRAGATPGDALAPVASYDPNAERDSGGNLPASRSPQPETPPPSPVTQGPTPAAPPPSRTASPGPESSGEVVTEQSDDILTSNGARRYVRIPSYTRGLVLDDGNIAHGAAFRMAWAQSVKVRETAVASAFFFEGQVAFTRAFGLELTVPTEYVNVDVDRARAVYTLGNPLVAAKWRLQLPKVMDRRPALTLRARVAIPLAPLHSIPPTNLGVEDFSREAHFADTYAFFLEKTDIGLGASLTWQWKILRFGAQLYTDYFIPVSDAVDRTDFAALSWGASVGALPFGDIVGFFAEARAVSLFAGPGRTEFFTYLGARGRLLDMFEPALWITLPLGSVRNANTFQIGAELRFSYDVYDVVDPGGRTDRLNDSMMNE